MQGDTGGCLSQHTLVRAMNQTDTSCSGQTCVLKVYERNDVLGLRRLRAKLIWGLSAVMQWVISVRNYEHVNMMGMGNMSAVMKH